MFKSGKGLWLQNLIGNYIKMKVKVLKKFFSIKRKLNSDSNEQVRFNGDFEKMGKFNDKDVFIVGFPKSGNTLMQHIVAYLVYGLNENVNRSLINLLTSDIYKSNAFFRFDERCFFKSHEFPRKEYRNVIYIVRDGREVMLSYYHMLKNMGMEISLKDLYSQKFKPNGSTWSEHVEAWKENPYNAKIHWVVYENLIDDKKKELGRLCEFLNLERSNSELNDVIRMTSLEFMQEKENKPDWKRMKKGRMLKGRFIRNGEKNSYLQNVPKELIYEFEKKSSDTIFTYKEFVNN
jgi:sulfotransferase family protein